MEWGCLWRAGVSSAAWPSLSEAHPVACVAERLSWQRQCSSWNPQFGVVPWEDWPPTSRQADYIVPFVVDDTVIWHLFCKWFVFLRPFQHHHLLTYRIIFYSPSCYPTQCFWPRDLFPWRKKYSKGLMTLKFIGLILSKTYTFFTINKYFHGGTHWVFVNTLFLSSRGWGHRS